MHDRAAELDAHGAKANTEGKPKKIYRECVDFIFFGLEVLDLFDVMPVTLFRVFIYGIK